MSIARKAPQSKNDGMRKLYFAESEDGGFLYFPHGIQNIYVLSKRTYKVPSEQLVDRIIALQRRWSWACTAVTIAILFAGLLALLKQPDGVFGVVRSVPWLVFPALIALGVMPAYLPSWLTVWQAGPLEPGRDRSYRDFVQLQERRIGARAVWIFSIAIVVFFVFTLAVAWQAADKGHVGVALSIVAMAGILLPMTAVGPALSRYRRLRAENERLEAVVAERTRELRDLNRTLEDRVEEQVRHIEKLGQLKHFFAAPVAEMILNDKGFDPARVHRRELTAVSLDLRGFTAFSETSEPEEVISVLRVYHAELGIQVNRHGATLEHFAGDGVMLFLNDPVEVEDHPMRALELAVALRDAMRPHLDEWRSNGFDIGLGIGIATGYATIGAVGYEGRWEYAAIGTVCNLAARLCSEAKDGQIVVSKRYMSRLGERATFEPLGERPLKGLSRPVAMFNVVRLGVPVAATKETAG